MPRRHRTADANNPGRGRDGGAIGDEPWDDVELLLGDDRGPAPAAAGCSGGGEARAGALDEEGAFSLGECGHDVEDDLAGDGVGGVDAAMQGANADVAGGELVDEFDQGAADATEPVE